MASNTKKDWPNAAGFAWGSRRTNVAPGDNKDDELRYTNRAKGKTEGAAKAGDGAGHKPY